MIEGWHGDDYLMMFDEVEASALSVRYGIDRFLPGYVIMGLRGWDDFIVKGPDGRLSTVPTVPAVAEHLAPLDIAIDARRIVADDRFRGRVKWYTKPLVFGGSPTDNDNIVWVLIDQHVDLVRWWNDQYHSLK